MFFFFTHKELVNRVQHQLRSLEHNTNQSGTCWTKRRSGTQTSAPPLLLSSSPLFIYIFIYLSFGSCRMMERISSIKASPTGWCFDARSPPRFWPPFLLLLLLLHHHHLLLPPARVLRCPPRAGVTTNLALLYSHMLSPARL